MQDYNGCSRAELIRQLETANKYAAQADAENRDLAEQLAAATRDLSLKTDQIKLLDALVDANHAAATLVPDARPTCPQCSEYADQCVCGPVRDEVSAWRQAVDTVLLDAHRGKHAMILAEVARRKGTPAAAGDTNGETK